MELSEKKLKKLLVNPGFIALDDFERIKSEAKSEAKSIEKKIVEAGLIKEDQLTQLIAEELDLKYFNTRLNKIDENIFKNLPFDFLFSNLILPFEENESEIKVAMVDVEDVETIRNLEEKFKKNISIFLVGQNDLNDFLLNLKPGLKEEYENILEKSGHNNKNANIELVDLILTQGYYKKASDVHIEPYYNKAIIRFRIDGILREVLEVPKEVYSNILARIKIMAKLRIDDQVSAKDGKIIFKIEDKFLDIRVSVVPITEGENIVLRLLSDKNRVSNFDDLGFRQDDYEKVKNASRKRDGMIIVSGPTGSGKTTTLYEIIKILNSKMVHISTIEDPVEYDIEGISQIQVNKNTNLTFAKGLRAIVRQDPDIIMVGEIRDDETAGISVKSAMTGHLVLSTIHANNAAATVPRLIDMGVEPYLLASSLNIVISQRLVKRLCENCRESAFLSDEEKKLLSYNDEIIKYLKKNNKENLDNLIVFKAKGCKKCNNSGYEGRIGIYEVMKVSDEVKKMILKKSSSDEIAQVAKNEGMSTMLEDGLEKVALGLTTVYEVFNIISID